MGVVDTLLRRKKVVKTTIVEIEEFEEDNDVQNERDKEHVRSILSDLNTRVKFLELELKNIGGR